MEGQGRERGHEAGGLRPVWWGTRGTQDTDTSDSHRHMGRTRTQGDVAMGSTRTGTPTLPGDRDTPKRHEDPDKHPPPPLHWVIVHACAWPCMCVHRRVHVAGHACPCCWCHACAHTSLRTSMGCVCERQHVCTYMRVQACGGAPIPVCAHACARGGRWNHLPGCSWGPGPGSLSRRRRERPAGCPESSPGSPHAPRAGGSTWARSPGKGRRLQGWPEGAEAGGVLAPPALPQHRLRPGWVTRGSGTRLFLFPCPSQAAQRPQRRRVGALGLGGGR